MIDHAQPNSARLVNNETAELRNNGIQSAPQSSGKIFERSIKMLGTVLLILLVLLLVGALPSWPYSAGWGYYPSGGVGLLVAVVLVLLLLRVI